MPPEAVRVLSLLCGLAGACSRDFSSFTFTAEGGSATGSVSGAGGEREPATGGRRASGGSGAQSGVGGEPDGARSGSGNAGAGGGSEGGHSGAARAGAGGLGALGGSGGQLPLAGAAGAIFGAAGSAGSGPACAPGLLMCGSDCVAATTDTQCGGCDNDCTAQGSGEGLVCVQGVCGCFDSASCGDGSSCTQYGRCRCGGNVCRPGEACVDRACSCNGGEGCGPGEVCCQTPAGCRALASDADSCGACGRACPVEQTCVDGACVN